VARHEYRHALLVGQAAEQRSDLDDARRIETVGGFVEYEEFGGMEEGAGKGEPLLVAQGEPPGAPVDVLPELEEFDRVIGSAGRGAGRRR